MNWNEIHTDSQFTSDTLAFVNEYITCVLSYGNSWPVILSAPSTSPSNPLSHCLAADFYMSAEMKPDAVKSLETAESLYSMQDAASRTATTTKYLAAMRSWVNGDFTTAADNYAAVLIDRPSDIFALKRAQLMAFFDGDRVKLLSVIEGPLVAAANEGRPFFYGMLGFALEQNGRLEEAEAAGRRGTAIYPEDPWSHHAVGHALYFKGKLVEGVNWLVPLSHHWKNCCSFMLTHNWWHVGLFYLEACQFERLEKTFDERIWIVDKTNIQDQLGALGMLLKWELRRDTNSRFNGALSSRWTEVIQHCLKSAHLMMHADLLFDVLLVFALFKFGYHDDGDKLVSSCVEMANNAHVNRRAKLQSIYIPTVRAMKSFAEGNYADCVTCLSPHLGSTDILGGSEEQRDVVEEVCIEAMLEVEDHHNLVEGLLRQRLARRDGVPSPLVRLSRCQKEKGPSEECAAKAQAMVDRYNHADWEMIWLLLLIPIKLLNAICPMVSEQGVHGAQIWGLATVPYDVQGIGKGGVTYLSAGGDEKLFVWTTASTNKVAEFNIGSICYCVIVIPGGMFLTGSNNPGIQLFAFGKPTALKTFGGHTSPVECLLNLHDGTFASGSDDRTVKLWDINTGVRKMNFQGHGGVVWCLAAMQDGTLISGSDDYTIKQWDKTKSTAIMTYQYGAYVMAVMALDGDYFIAAGGGSLIKKYKVGTASAVFTYEKVHAGNIRSFTMVDLTTFLSSASDGLLYRWHFDMSKPLTKYQHSDTNKGVYSATILSDGTFAAAGYDRKVKRFSYRSYWTGASAITSTTSPMQCCSVQTSAPGPGLYMWCEVGSSTNPGHNLLALPCSSVSTGSYLAQACQGGNATMPGSDAVVRTCSQPADGGYVSSVCEPGGEQETGADTVTSPCPVIDAGEGRFQYYFQTCTKGDALSLGIPSVVRNCTKPSDDQYVMSPCSQGDGIFISGSDTVMLPCSSPSEGQGQYVSRSCVSGDPFLPGSDTKESPCLDPPSNHYTTAACVTGDSHTAGEDTKIEACSLPFSGTYTAVACDRGDRYTVGSNTELKPCSKVMNPLTQVIKKSCDGGSSSMLGSDIVIASTCSVGHILDPNDKTFQCSPCPDSKWTSQVGKEVCDVCKAGYHRIEKGVLNFSCEIDSSTPLLDGPTAGNSTVGIAVGTVAGVAVLVAFLLFVRARRRSAVTTV